MKHKEGYVYWIHLDTHTDILKDGYVGITNNPEKRWQIHKTCKSACQHLENAIKKYSWDNLIKEIIFIGEYSDCVNIELHLRPRPSIGWNIRQGGGSNGGLSDEAKVKISKANAGNKYCLGRVLSEDTRNKIATAHLGKTLTLEHKLSIGAGGCVKVICINTGEVFTSILEAKAWCGLSKNSSSISAVCKGRRKTAGKHPLTNEKLKWEYYDEA